MSKFDNNNIGNYLLKVNRTIIFTLQDAIQKSGITKYKLSKITNIRYDTICNYCKGTVTICFFFFIISINKIQWSMFCFIKCSS